ncbi:hypothetical protein WA026_012075 [Henosepilachna vigintioctopunctata]|uniref:Uncharacterized protein n=1 Tax=Henosepilachna vigintioctopunctata TaxID=420089 RepID=A0AAW1V4W4_9CUCU
MKFLLVLVAVFAVSYSRKIDMNELVNKIKSYSGKDSDSSEEIEDLIKDGLKDVSNQIEVAICKTNGTRVYDAALKSLECAKASKSDDIICDSMNAEFKKCIKPIEKVFEECLEAKYHDVPKLIINSIVSTSEYLCNSKVRDVVELSNKCAAVDVEKLKSCVSGIEEKFKHIENVKNLKTEVCSELVKHKDCLLGQVNKNCKHDVTKKSFSNLFEAAITKPCAA